MAVTSEIDAEEEAGALLLEHAESTARGKLLNVGSR
jgi:hypothetical protein